MEDIDWEIVWDAGSIIGSIVSVLLGVAAAFLGIYLTFITASDVLYLSFPTYRTAINRNYDGRALRGLKLVSQDAIKSVDESYRDNRSAFTIYVQKRLGTYIFAATMLVLISTNGQSIREILTKVLIVVFQSIGLIK